MPTYEYQCNSCGHSFEAFQRITEDPLKRCPRCGKKVRRLIGGGVGIIFKGSGFYTTDNKRSSVVTGGNGSGKSKPAAGETKTETKTETKSGADKKETPVSSTTPKSS
jgi:putative FmdB family regulatory protein